MLCFYRDTRVERIDNQDCRKKATDTETPRMQCSLPPYLAAGTQARH